ncbi:kinesin motor domain-domain-containing protein [Lobosporangium transversale]|uniref:Kinesin-like protein n=1 Tax=Lobosporangium transversale TaxID=64571 RepID=A0A1Y2GGT8_9FUNG|nr:kinesin motor domain-domain-containing protein [Lobosporangium transversale]ORZ10584.1 kinesin motor domain-domain-containing protein [Lobosporangium transversale]|eukprot:XP_021879305.1 kinesin motor domain-domain-containing protein [Lobosporangium transversale]
MHAASTNASQSAERYSASLGGVNQNISRTKHRSLFLPPPKLYKNISVKSPIKKKLAQQSPEARSHISLSDLALLSSPAASTVSTESIPSSPTVLQHDSLLDQYSFHHDLSDSEPVKIFLRIRSIESKGHESYVKVLNKSDVLLSPSPHVRFKEPSKYEFFRAFEPTAIQAEVFEEVCFPLIASVLLESNFSALLFGYGGRNSGKAHTMIGSNHPGKAGILPRALAVIFRSIGQCVESSDEADQYRPVGYQGVEMIEERGQGVQKSLDGIKSQFKKHRNSAKKLGFKLRDLPKVDKTDTEDHIVDLPNGMAYAVWISYAELYMDKIYDLLGEAAASNGTVPSSINSQKPALDLRTDITGQKYIHGLKEIRVRTLDEALLVLQTGLAQRHVSVALSKTPSRSHFVFTIKVLKTPQLGNSAAETAAIGKTSVSRLSIVDLAGSERLHSASSNLQKQREIVNINSSLMHLRQCLEVFKTNLQPKVKSRQPVPYKQSKLTQTFQAALNEKSNRTKISVVVNVNPRHDNYEETRSTLRFSMAPESRLNVHRTEEHTGHHKITSPDSHPHSSTHTSAKQQRREKSPLKALKENPASPSITHCSEYKSSISLLPTLQSDQSIVIQTIQTPCTPPRKRARRFLRDDSMTGLQIDGDGNNHECWQDGHGIGIQAQGIRDPLEVESISPSSFLQDGHMQIEEYTMPEILDDMDDSDDLGLVSVSSTQAESFLSSLHSSSVTNSNPEESYPDIVKDHPMNDDFIDTISVDVSSPYPVCSKFLSPSSVDEYQNSMDTSGMLHGATCDQYMASIDDGLDNHDMNHQGDIEVTIEARDDDEDKDEALIQYDRGQTLLAEELVINTSTNLDEKVAGNDAMEVTAKKPKRRLRIKNAVMLEEMEESIGIMPQSRSTRSKKRAYRVR